jgi:hypothetical protein
LVSSDVATYFERDTMPLGFKHRHILLGREGVEGPISMEPRRRVSDEKERMRSALSDALRDIAETTTNMRRDMMDLSRGEDKINQSRALGHAKPTTESGHEENIKRLMQWGGYVFGERAFACRHVLDAGCFKQRLVVRMRHNLQLAGPPGSRQVNG